MDERLRSKPQFQRVIDAREMLLARADHPVAQSATADRNAGALECLRQAVERCAVDVFVNEREGQRRGRGDAARQGLRRHRRGHDRRVDPGAVAMAACIFEPHILQDLRLHLDMKLLGNGLAHAMHLVTAARTSLLIVGKVILDALARQVFRQGLRPRFFPAVLSVADKPVSGRSTTSPSSLSASSSSAACSASLKRRSMCFSLRGAKRCSRASASSSSSLTTRSESWRFSACSAAIGRAINSSTVGSPGRFIEFLNLNACRRVNSSIRELSAGNLILPHRMADHRIDIDAVENPV